MTHKLENNNTNKILPLSAQTASSGPEPLSPEGLRRNHSPLRPRPPAREEPPRVETPAPPRPATPNLPVSCHLHWELRKPGWRKAREARYALHLDSEDVGLCSLQGGAWRRASESTAVPPPRPPPQTAVGLQGPPCPSPTYLPPGLASACGVQSWRGAGGGRAAGRGGPGPSPAFTEQWMCALDS